MSDSIVFDAAVSQVKTLADGGIRVQLDLPEDAIPQMAMLAECKRAGIYLTFEAKTRETDLDNETDKGAERKTTRLGRRRS